MNEELTDIGNHAPCNNIRIETNKTLSRFKPGTGNDDGR